MPSITRSLLIQLCALFLLLNSSPALAQEDDKRMSWLASGDATASYSIENLGLSVTLDGTHQEIAFYQDRSPFSNLFTGWHFIIQEYSGEGTDNVGELHKIEYKNQSVFFSLGYDWYLAEFVHLQPYLAYGFGASTYSTSVTDAVDKVTPYGENTNMTDIGSYGVNLILELTGKLWLGFAQNYFVESQSVKFDSGDATLEPQSSQTLMLVWNWERVPIKSIDPKASFFGF